MDSIVNPKEHSIRQKERLSAPDAIRKIYTI